MKERVESLDYLRGLMALSVLFSHYYSWTFPNNSISTNFTVRLSIYAVATFYILSGLSLSIVYHNKIQTINDIKSFLIKRCLRILPLLWLVATIEIINSPISYYKNHNYSLITILLNYTGTFGFFNPRSYISFGTWSIGNEMVFYALFPLFIILFNKKVRLGMTTTLVAVFLGALFAFFGFDRQSDLIGIQWNMYIQPANQLFLFASGISIFYLLRHKVISNIYLLAILAISIIVFIYIPIKGKDTLAISGFYRFHFSIICIILVAVFYKIKLKIPNSLKFILNTIGISSYSIYLLHTFVYKLLEYIFSRLYLSFPIIMAISSLIITLVLSVFVYKYFELPFMRLAKRITEKGNKSYSTNLNYN